ncbi:MAG TPA: hypothetical protein VHJ34_11810 [Actinomycetota bacterium]|nr:hypothetical protein [Actinomycetota bacterium]
MPALAHGEPAAGAPLHDVVPATVVALALVAAVAAGVAAHRAGRTAVLTRVGDVAARAGGVPPWAALPAAVAGVSLLVAVFGFYWDVATHIDYGRDPGPFANPSHFLIIGGLVGIALAGVAGIALGCQPTRSSVRLRAGWHAPLGAVLLLLCGGIAVAGFPLDDVWHRLFGQDVTLWSPTHLQMVGGAALSTLALWILVVEGLRAAAPRDGRVARAAETLVAGAFLIGLSALQAEFDYSVPQFRLLYHPVLVAGSAALALVAARVRLGPRGALGAVATFFALRGVLTLAIGPGLGHTTLHVPLYVVEAVAVEIVARWFPTRRPVAFGAVAGAAVGTVGLAAEWAWSHAWMTIPWPAALLPEGAVVGFVAAVSAGAAGGYVGRALCEPDAARRRTPAPAAVATAGALLVALAYPLPVSGAVDGSAAVTLEPVGGYDRRWVRATVELRPADLGRDALWLNVTAWQGGRSVVVPLERAGDAYVARAPIPVHGEWKALIRLHSGTSLSAVPLYLPRDDAIPAPEVPARERFARPFVLDERIVLREAKDVPAALTYAATGALTVLVAAWVAALVYGLRRLERGVGPPRAARDRIAGAVQSATPQA